MYMILEEDFQDQNVGWKVIDEINEKIERQS